MFDRFRRLKVFERQHLAFRQPPLDCMVLIEIGYYQEQGSPLTVKRLLLLKLGAPATVLRHLQRLVRQGLVHKFQARHDGRVFQLELDAAVRRTYAKYLKLLSQL